MWLTIFEFFLHHVFISIMLAYHQIATWNGKLHGHSSYATTFIRSCLFKFLMGLSTWSGEISSCGIGQVDRKWRWCWSCSWCISPTSASRATLACLIFGGQWTAEPPAMVFYPNWKMVLPILFISFLEGLSLLCRCFFVFIFFWPLQVKHNLF